jgi:hypothetical protein
VMVGMDVGIPPNGCAVRTGRECPQSTGTLNQAWVHHGRRYEG